MKLHVKHSLEGALNQLNERGFIANFKFINGKMSCLDPLQFFSPKELLIVEFHRFESYNDTPSSLIFAIKGRNGVKGVLIVHYDQSPDKYLIDFMNQVNIKASKRMASSNN